MEERIEKTLIGIVGRERYTASLIDLVSYSYDASEFSGSPECAIWPDTTEEISKILAVANQAAIPVAPSGAGTGLSGLSIPWKGGSFLYTGKSMPFITLFSGSCHRKTRAEVAYKMVEHVLGRRCTGCDVDVWRTLGIWKKLDEPLYRPEVLWGISGESLPYDVR